MVAPPKAPGSQDVPPARGRAQDAARLPRRRELIKDLKKAALDQERTRLSRKRPVIGWRKPGKKQGEGEPPAGRQSVKRTKPARSRSESDERPAMGLLVAARPRPSRHCSLPRRVRPFAPPPDHLRAGEPTAGRGSAFRSCEEQH